MRRSSAKISRSRQSEIISELLSELFSSPVPGSLEGQAGVENIPPEAQAGRPEAEIEEGRRSPQPSVAGETALAQIISVQPPTAGSRGLFLDPLCLSPEARNAARTILKAGESPNTRRAYEVALRYWQGWYGLRYGTALTLPVSVSVLVQFLVDHLDIKDEHGKSHQYALKGDLEIRLIASGIKARRGPPAWNTVMQRIAVLSGVHESKRLKNPTRDPVIKQLLASARRAYGAAKKRPKSKKALTLDLLRKMLDTCECDLRGKRDRALLLLAFASGGRRRSEVSALRLEDLIRTEDGNFKFVLGKTKTDQKGELLEEKPVNGEAAEALHDWLEASSITHGALFRRVIRGVVKGPLSGDAIWLIVRRRAALAGLAEQDFGAHSLRSGFVTEAARQGAPIGEVMKLTGHRSVKTALGYYKAGEVSTLAAANLLNKKPGRS